jgi:hypothetical protein
VLHLDDAVASKVTALLGRGLARDYIDVAALDRYPLRRLLQLAFERDPGLRVLDVALAAQRLDQLPDSRFGRYGLDPNQVLSVRAHFADWPRDSAADQIAQAAHGAAHRPEPTAATERPGGFRALRNLPPVGSDASVADLIAATHCETPERGHSAAFDPTPATTADVERLEHTRDEGVER